MSRQEDINKRLDLLEAAVTNSTSRPVQEGRSMDFADELCTLLPLDSIAQFDEFEKKLKNNSEYCTKTVIFCMTCFSLCYRWVY